MRPEDLYSLETDPDVTSSPDGSDGTVTGPVMLLHLDGFVDAGTAGTLAVDQVFTSLEHRPVARFDVDALVDYRSRRPPVTFVSDHYESYQAPELVLHEVIDDGGTPFLVLRGPEPDVMWERFAEAVQQLVRRFGVRLVVNLHAIPMAVPHTRPMGMTAHATRRELLAGGRSWGPSWVGTVQVPGTAASLLELRLGAAGYDALGFAVHVPHYLAQVKYPSAAAALVSAVSEVTGLSLPVEGLIDAAADARHQVDEQVAGSEEIAAVVHALEEQYDAFVAGQEDGRPPLLAQDQEMPSADELGAQVEQFLAERGDPPQR